MKRIVILQILLCAVFASAAIDPNLVAWWQLDEGTGNIVNDSADSRNGTVYGAIWEAGQIGGALRFDGINDYVELPNNNPIWLPQNNLTVSTWVYFDKDPVCSTVEFVLGLNFTYWNDPTLWIGYCIHRNWCDGKAVFQMQTATSTDKLYSENILSKNNWYHIVGVRNGTTQEIYLNGKLEGTRTCSPGPIQFSGRCNDHKVSIGKATDGCGTSGNYFLDGLVDDVRIYNRALTAEEVLELYQGTEPNLVGIEITGPDEVAENSTASYSAIATYDDGTTKNVTALAEWLVEPETIADINNGQLTIGQLIYPSQNIEVYAEYTENQVDVGAQKQVSVIAICPQGNAMKFDGSNDYVQIPDSPNNQITTNQMSISAWIKLTSDIGATQRRIICKQQTNSVTWALLVGGNGYSGLTGNQVVFHDSDGTNTSICISPTNLIPGNWYHIGVSDNAGQIRLYINGVLNQSVDNGYGIPSQITAPIMIGRTNPDSTFFFDGTIDEVSVFNRALSADEIQALMFTKLSGSEVNLIAYWDFDEGTGQMAFDVSGHGNDGALGSTSGPDISDPCWVESNTPVGQCTTEQVLGRNLFGAIDDKKEANQLIANAKAKERASLYLIDELRQSGDVNRPDAFRAKTKICTALFQEEMVSWEIKATMKRLEESLRILDYWIDLNSEP